MKKILSFVMLVALFGMSIAGLAQAATEGTVTATVTVLYTSVSINNTSFDYGTVPANTASSTLALWGGAGIVATLTGANTDVDIKGDNTTGGTGWTLSGTANTDNNYMHYFCNDTDNVCTDTGSNYTALTTSYAVLDTGISNGNTVAFQLNILTPQVPTAFVQQSSVVTILATAK